jgi:hypothetical protein
VEFENNVKIDGENFMHTAYYQKSYLPTRFASKPIALNNRNKFFPMQRAPLRRNNLRCLRTRLEANNASLFLKLDGYFKSQSRSTWNTVHHENRQKKNLPLIIRANTTRKNFNCKIANKRFDWFGMKRFNTTFLGTNFSNAIWVFYLIETYDDWMAKEKKKKLSKYQIAGGRIKRFFLWFFGAWLAKSGKLRNCVSHISGWLLRRNKSPENVI